MTAIRPSFEAKKQKILQDLSVPDDEYSDLSPKGSVDEGIRDLIGDINGLPGLVTTSSCAGRVSIFLEGSKDSTASKDSNDEREAAIGDRNEVDGKEEATSTAAKQFVPSGGKGSGRWLFVSHDPVGDHDGSLHGLFGLTPGDGRPASLGNGGLRLVRFHYDPMILHVMTATLKHAQPVLAAATSAGFRESGVQSLRCLDDEDVSPIVAVRSSGMALESVIGYAEILDGKEVVRSLITDECLRMLLDLANERFKVNAERVERFRTRLLEFCAGDPGAAKSTRRPADWEDESARRERKRAEGLRRREAMAQAASGAKIEAEDDVELSFPG